MAHLFMMGTTEDHIAQTNSNVKLDVSFKKK